MQQTCSFGTQFNNSHIHACSGKKTKKQNYAPFLIKNRYTTQIRQPYPSPGTGYLLSKGQYDQEEHFIKKKQHFKRNMVIKKNRESDSDRLDQSVNFKSTMARFDNFKNQIPGPTTYNISLVKPITEKKKKNLDHKLKNNRKKTYFSEARQIKYPSIPHKNLKYGYSETEGGKYTPIQKTNEQLEKQRDEGKDYLKRLIKQKQYSPIWNNIPRQSNQMTYPQLIQKLNNKQKSPHTSSHQRQKSYHLPLKTTFYNKQKIQQALDTMKKSTRFIGPGCYDLPSSLSKEKKQMKYQFFNSSQHRFKEVNNIPKNRKEDSFSEKFSLYQKQHMMTFSKIRKSLKKPQRMYHESKKQEQCAPGPNQYHPKQQLVKKKSTASFIGKSERFKSTVSEQDQSRFKKELTIPNQKKTLYNFNKLKRLRRNIRDEPKENEKDKENMREISSSQIPFVSKTKRLHVERQYIIQNKTSDYSICEWENRPNSRFDPPQLTIKHGVSSLTSTPLEQKKSRECIRISRN